MYWYAVKNETISLIKAFCQTSKLNIDKKRYVPLFGSQIHNYILILVKIDYFEPLTKSSSN